MIKVLVLLGDLNRCNGISSYVMNYYKKIDKKKFSFDFIITSDIVDSEYENYIKNNNSKIYFVKSPKIISMFKDLYNIKKFLKSHLFNYDIFYCHLVNQGYFYLNFAKKLGFKNRVFHSHNIVTREKNILRDFRNQSFKKMISKNASYFLACSTIAGEDVLGKNGNFKLINNAIDLNKYVFKKSVRDEYREKFQLNNVLTFVQVGRLAYQKNPQFTIEIMHDLKKYNPNIKLLFIGEGPYESELKKMVNDFDLENEVLFLGTRNDVDKFYMASDVLLFPSRFEGLGMVAIEAQVSGLNCFASEFVPLETKITNNIIYLPLNKNIWVKEILKLKNFADRGDYSQDAKKHGFDINTEVLKLESFFESIVNK